MHWAIMINGRIYEGLSLRDDGTKMKVACTTSTDGYQWTLIDDDNSPKSHQQLEDKMNSLGNSYTYQAVNVGGDKMNCQGFCFHMCAFATNKSIVEASAKIASLMGNVLF